MLKFGTLRNMSRGMKRSFSQVDGGRNRVKNELQVRGLPRDAKTGINHFRNSKKSMNNRLSSGETWIDKIEYFKNLRKVSYDSRGARNDLVDSYLKKLKDRFTKTNKESTKELLEKIEKCTKDYLKQYRNQFANFEETLKIEKRAKVENPTKLDTIVSRYDNDVRDIKYEHSPTVYAVPGSPSFDYLSDFIKLGSGNKTIFFSFDVEAFEFDSDVVTEIGISIYDPRENIIPSLTPNIRNYHLIVQEALYLKNSKYVCDSKECFLNGESLVLPLEQCVEFLQSLMNFYMIPKTEADKTWKRAFVGHNIKGDISWLRKVGVQFQDDSKIDYTLKDANNSNKTDTVYIADTQIFYNKCYGPKGSSLGKILRLFELPHTFLHNAGNDAFYTLKVMMYMTNINFRLRFDMDNLLQMSLRIKELLHREEIEKKIVPMQYNIVINESINEPRKYIKNNVGSKKKKQLVHQTEITSSIWFNNAESAFLYNHFKTFNN